MRVGQGLLEKDGWGRQALAEGPFNFRKVRARREKKVLIMVHVSSSSLGDRQAIDVPHSNYDLLILIRVSTKTKWISLSS